MIQAVIFDLDGTLLDTLGDIALVMNELLERHGATPHDKDAYRLFVGRGLNNLVYDALPDARKDDAEKLYREALGIFASRGVGIAVLYPGVRETLEALRSKGLPLPLRSNKPEAAVKAIIKELNMEDFFCLIAGATPDIPLKPHPDSVLPIVRQLQRLVPGCASASIAFVGDSDVDMRTAKNAGLYAVGAAWGFRGAAELAEAGADIILAKIRELFPLAGL